MHIESLDARLCFSAGIDTTFGTAGRVLLSYDSFAGPVAATADRVEVAYASGSGANAFATLTARGRYLGGYIAADAAGAGEVDQVLPLASGAAYTLGATDLTSTPGGTRAHFVSVTRYTAAGMPDPRFGTDGTIVYDLSNTTAYDLKFDDAVATADGGVIVAFDRARKTGDRVLSDVVLLKLRANGRRDTAFGVNGTKVVINAGYDSTRPVVDTVAGYDLTADADGSIRVVLSRTQGIRVAAATGDTDADVGMDASVMIKSVTVTAAGADDAAKTRSWLLATPSDEADEDTRFIPLLVADDGPTGVTVIGRSRAGSVVTRPQAYVLRIGHRARVSPFATGTLTASQVVRTDNGKYVALLRGNAVARLSANFKRDLTFGTGGIASPDLSDVNPGFSPRLYASPHDRVIVPLIVDGYDGEEERSLVLLRLG